MDIKITPCLLNGEVQSISSKSDLHRALIAASLSDLTTLIKYNGLSKDIEATLNCLCAMGATFDISENQITVTPINNPQNAVLDCGESGSTLRFLLPLAPALKINASFTGYGRLPKRPLSPLYEELQKKGCQLTEQGVFPLNVSGTLESGNFTLAGNISSQFVTGLMFALPLLNGDSIITLLPPVESKSYINMTVDILSKFGIEITEQKNVYYIKGNQKYKSPTYYEVEGDWSNSAFWLCAGALSKGITVKGLTYPSLQGDSAILDILAKMGAEVLVEGNKITVKGAPLCGTNIVASDIPDLVPIISVISAFATGITHISGAQRLKIKESDRLHAVTEFLSLLGANIKQLKDGLIIEKSNMKGGKVDSFSDHRIAMSAAIAASNCKNDVIITNAQAVEKSYPLFFTDYNMLGGKADVL